MASLTQDKDETRLLYGKFVPFDQILEGKVRRQHKPAILDCADALHRPQQRRPKASAAREVISSSVFGCPTLLATFARGWGL
jgi:hypothetical protein